MSMYLKKDTPKAAHELDQGDILIGVLRPDAPLAGSLHVRDQAKATQVKVDKGEASLPVEKLRSLVKVETPAFSMVLSNSCDNFQRKQFILAPLREFKFNQRSTTDAEKWGEIQAAATGGKRPGAFYMPGDAELGLTRSWAMFDELFVVEPSWVDQCFTSRDAKRVAGLSVDGVRHLQWSLGYFFSRNPREDLAWPSQEDLLLKKAYLEAFGSRHKFLQEELKELNAFLVVSPPQGTGSGG